MAVINKNFKIKNGLIVEGTTGTINNYDILTKKQEDQNYIIGLIGGSATANATANTVVLRDGNANFAANVITADLVGDVTGQVSDISNFTTDNFHNFSHQIKNYDVIVNCIADTNTYSTDKDSHWKTNYVFVNDLIQFCNSHNIKLVQIIRRNLY